MEQQGSRLQYYKNRRSSGSSDELKSKLQEFGQNVKRTSQRADQLLQNSQYPQSSLYAHPTSLPSQQQFSQIQVPLQQQIYQQPPQHQTYQPVQQYMKQPQIQSTYIQQQPIQQTFVQQKPIQQTYVQQLPVQQSIQQFKQTQRQPGEQYSYISGQEKGQVIEEKYLEYVPYDRTEIEYVPVQKIEYVPQEKKIREYQLVERVIEKLPIKTYETTIEYVPVERVEEHIEYQTRERQIVKEKIPQEQYQKIQGYQVPQQSQYVQQVPTQAYNPVAISQQNQRQQQPYWGQESQQNQQYR